MTDEPTLDELLGDVEIVPAAWRGGDEEAGQ
jgi:hypothetical protein